MMPAAPPLVVVLMGVSGCGKTTTGTRLSKKLGWPFRDADSFHPAANIEKMSRGIALDDDDRRPWLDAISVWIDERLAQGEPGIVSCSALKRAYRRRIVGDRRGVQLVYLRGPMELIGRRLQGRRNHFMPAALLQSQYDALEEPGPGERPIIVSVALTPQRVLATIVEQLGVRLPQPEA